MKKLTFKLKTYIALGAIALTSIFCSAMMTIGRKTTAKAEETQVFEMLNANKLRLDGDGMAFGVKMNQTTVDDIQNNGKELYFMIIPEDYLARTDKLNGSTDYSAWINQGDDYLLVSANSTISLDATLGEGVYTAYAGIGDVKAENKSRNFVSLACIKSGETYAWADFASGKTSMPAMNEYKLVNSALVNTEVDSAKIVTHYGSWFGTGNYPVSIEKDEQFTQLVNKAATTESLKDMYIHIKDEVTVADADLAQFANAEKYLKVNFYDSDKLLLSKDVKKGGSVSISGTPVRAKTAQYTYTFDKWVTEENGETEADLTNVQSSMNVYAKFTATVNKYVVTWNIDGEETTEEVEYGTVPSHEDPVKATDNRSTYEFDGWDKELAAVTEDVTYIAQFKKSSYVFFDYSDAEGNDVSKLSGYKIEGDDYAEPDSYNLKNPNFTKSFTSVSTDKTVIDVPYVKMESVAHEGNMLRVNFQSGMTEEDAAALKAELQKFDKVSFYVYSSKAGPKFIIMRADFGLRVTEAINLVKGWNLITLSTNDLAGSADLYIPFSECLGLRQRMGTTKKEGVYFTFYNGIAGAEIRISSLTAYTNKKYEEVKDDLAIKQSYTFLDFAKEEDMGRLSGYAIDGDDYSQIQGAYKLGNPNYTKTFTSVSAGDSDIGISYAKMEDVAHTGDIMRVNFQAGMTTDDISTLKAKLQGFNKVAFYVYSSKAGVKFQISRADFGVMLVDGGKAAVILNQGWNLVTLDASTLAGKLGLTDRIDSGVTKKEGFYFLFWNGDQGAEIRISSLTAYTTEEYAKVEEELKNKVTTANNG